jgi:hypothetical protein
LLFILKQAAHSITLIIHYYICSCKNTTYVDYPLKVPELFTLIVSLPSKSKDTQHDLHDLLSIINVPVTYKLFAWNHRSINLLCLFLTMINPLLMLSIECSVKTLIKLIFYKYVCCHFYLQVCIKTICWNKIHLKKNKWLNSYVTADFVTKKMLVVQIRPYLKERKLKKCIKM